MKFLSLAALAVLAFASSASAAPAQVQAIPNKYIITLKNDADQAQFTRALNAEVARENSQENAGIESKVEHTFQIADSFKGYSGTFTKNLVERLKNNPRVASVEEDLPVYALGTQTNPPSWGLTRVGQRTRSIPGPYVFPDNRGSGVTVYVIDTGVLTTHTDFGGRATHGFSSTPSWPRSDDNGHGTHVASTVAGSLHGVAKNARIVGVKVLSGSGSGSNSGVIAGINWVAEQARAAGRTVVANMSLGGGRNTATNSAVAAATRAGVVFAVAAGNESQDACNVSPASEPSAITVASSTRTDTLSSFSNFGSCVDIIAPGSDITGAWIGSNSAVRTISGTSMASPHVAGGAALVLGANPGLSPAQVTSAITSRATTGAITGNIRGTPNRLLFVN